MSMGFRDGIRILYTYTGLKQCTVIPGHTYVVKCKNFLILTGKPFFIEFHSFSGLHFFVTNAGISVIDACRTYLHMYLQCRYILQGFGSGSGLDPYSIGPVDPDSGEQNWPTKVEKIVFMFWSVGWPLLRAEGFFCNLDILYGGLGIGNCSFWSKKNKNKNFSCNFFSICGH